MTKEKLDAKLLPMAEEPQTSPPVNPVEAPSPKNRKVILIILGLIIGLGILSLVYILVFNHEKPQQPMPLFTPTAATSSPTPVTSSSPAPPHTPTSIPKLTSTLTPSSLKPTLTTASSLTYQLKAKSSLPIHLYQLPGTIYQEPEPSIKNIQIIGILFIPSNINLSKSDNYSQYDWKLSMQNTLSQVADYWYRELDTRSNISVRVDETPIRGSHQLAEYGINYGVSAEVVEYYQRQKNISPGMNPDGTYIVMMVYIATDTECDGYSQLGYEDYYQCAVALGKNYGEYSSGWDGISTMTDLFFAEVNNSGNGPITSAHEFGHTLNILHPQDDADINSSGIDFSRQVGNLMGHGVTILKDCYLMPEQKAKMGIET